MASSAADEDPVTEGNAAAAADDQGGEGSGDSATKPKRKTKEVFATAVFWCSVLGGTISMLAGLPGVPWRGAPASDQFRDYFKSSRTYTLFTMSGSVDGQSAAIHDVAAKMCKYEESFHDLDLDVVLDEVIQQATSVGGAAGSCKSWQLCKETVRNRCDKYGRLTRHGYITFALLCLGNLFATGTAFLVCTEKEKLRRAKRLQEEALQKQKEGDKEGEEAKAEAPVEEEEEEDEDEASDDSDSDEDDGVMDCLKRWSKHKKKMLTPFKAAQKTMQFAVVAFLLVAAAVATYIRETQKVFGDLGAISYYPFPDLKQGPKTALVGLVLLFLSMLVALKRYNDLKPAKKKKKKGKKKDKDAEEAENADGEAK